MDAGDLTPLGYAGLRVNGMSPLTIGISYLKATGR